MDYHVVEESLRAGYRQVYAQYRLDDEIEVTTPNHRHLTARLQELCSSFSGPIRVLDVGCGTGRYFHTLINVSQLTGLDISEEMLRAARQPVWQEKISVPSIRLMRGNAYLTSFPPGAFHLIYSLGMFGNGCPVTVELCNRFHDWLAPGGKLFFNAMDAAGLPLWFRARRQARHWIYPLLADRWRRALDERAARHPLFELTLRQLKNIMRHTMFSRFELSSHRCESPLWQGRHLECVAEKSAGDRLPS